MSQYLHDKIHSTFFQTATCRCQDCMNRQADMIRLDHTGSLQYLSCMIKQTCIIYAKWSRLRRKRLFWLFGGRSTEEVCKLVYCGMLMLCDKGKTQGTKEYGVKCSPAFRVKNDKVDDDVKVKFLH